MNRAEGSDQKLHAIIVDDDPIARRVASAVLVELGVIPLLEAADGVEAMSRIRGAGATIDLALCDLEMEGMDGVEFLAQLGSERPGMAVVLLSGMDQSLISAVANMASSSGLRVLGGLQKPLDRAELNGMISRISGKTASARANDNEPRITADDIRSGLDLGQFVPYFQPKIDVRTGMLKGAEALARWRHPSMGLVPPDRFIGLAEETGLISELTWSMLGSTMKTFSGVLPPGLEVSLSVNVTVSFLEELAVTENIVAMASREAVAPRRIVLELAESMATTDVVTVIGNLARLRLRGFGLSIDDFGTGYATMQQLSRIPFNELKLDRSFVSGASRHANLRVILESSLDLGKRLGLETVAEGVETIEDLALLRSLGCDTCQGFLIARPMPLEAFSGWIRDWEANERVNLLARLEEAAPV